MHKRPSQLGTENTNLTPNRQTFRTLLEAGGIDLVRGPIFDEEPRSFSVRRDKVEGMLLGLAIGDSLGNTSESMSPTRRRLLHGEIRDYLPNRHANGAPVGLPSDDTQLAYWTLEQLLKDGGVVPGHIADCFTRSRIYGIGSTVRAFIANRKQGMPWYECGPRSAGNGALMRIAPVIVPYLASPSTDLWVDTALCAMITHNDAGSIAACLAFVDILWKLLQMNVPPPADWWHENYTTVASQLEGQKRYIPRTPHYAEYEGPISGFVQHYVPVAYRRGAETVDACNQWYSGAYLLETVPCVLYILMRHADCPEEAIVRAVNDTRDNDTIAALVGCAIGALYGRDGLPQRWIRTLSGRTIADDDGYVFRLIEKALAKWLPPR